MTVLLLACLALLGPGLAAADGTREASWECLEGSVVPEDAQERMQLERCCMARRMWQEIEETGGCGGRSGITVNSNEDCRIAEALCRECLSFQIVRNATAGEGATTAAPEAGPMGAWLATQGDQAQSPVLAELDPTALQMRCALSQPMMTSERVCTDSVTDAGLAIVFVSGLLLLALSTAGAYLFDAFSLPALATRLTRPLEAVPPSSDRGSWLERALGGPCTPVGAPTELPTSPGRGRSPTFQAEAEGRSPPQSAQSAQSALRMAAAASPPPALASEPSWPEEGKPEKEGKAEQEVPRLAMLLQAAVGPSLHEPPKWAPAPGLWPPRLAAVWGFRKVFLRVACFALLVKLAQIVVCAVLTLRRGAPGLVLESVACVLPFLWCWVRSRPPSDTTAGIPFEVAYGGPCSRLPRFTVFALATVALELYSALDAAAEVASAPCFTEPWRLVVPYCMGILVAVLRAYSALLGLRLQEELAHACRRVLPVSQDMLDFSQDPQAPAEACDVGDVECSIGDGPLGGFSAPPTPSELALHASVEASVQAEFEKAPNDRRAPLPLDELDTSRFALPRQDDGPEEPPLRCAARCRRRLGKRCFLRFAVVTILITAASAAIVARMLRPDPAAQELPSSCATAQNATATCSDFSIVGQSYWDSAVGASLMSTADTLEDCCAGCDQVNGCQAWMFEHAARKCRWIAFREEPCTSNPGDLSCRCLSHFGRAFGFKPTSQIIWVQRGGSS